MLKKNTNFLFLFCISVILFTTCDYKSEETISFGTEEKVEASPKLESTNFPLEYEPRYAKVLNQNKWIIADHQAVWKTDNGGQSWQKSYEPPDSDQKPVNVRGLSFLHNEIIFLATDNFLLRSDNFGQTWYKLGELNFSTNAIFFVNEKFGWAVATAFRDDWTGEEKVPLFEGKIYTTNDGGISWTEKRIEGTKQISSLLDKWTLSDIVFFDSGKGFAVGDGIILQTDDYGENWKASNAEKYKYYKLGYLNEKVIWAMTTGGYREFSITKDGGNKWQTVSIPEDNLDTAQFIVFLDEKTALVGLNNLYITNTSGKSWSKIENPFHIYYVELEKDGSLIALARDEKRSFALYSVDEGKIWKEFSVK